MTPVLALNPFVYVLFVVCVVDVASELELACLVVLVVSASLSVRVVGLSSELRKLSAFCVDVDELLLSASVCVSGSSVPTNSH